MAKSKSPTTHEGFQKQLNKISKDGITTPEQANKFARLMLDSIDLEIEKLAEWKDNPMVQQLVEKYQRMKENWVQRLNYTEEQLKKSQK